MINLSNERINFTFEGTNGGYKFNGTCVYLEGNILDMNASISVDGTDASVEPGPIGQYIGNVTYNCPEGAIASDTRANIHIDVPKEHFYPVYNAVILTLEELERAN